ncbi:MetQ/NlpA family ABC transporter substrate-binding protein [Kocuria oceani]|uniref:MetQ/NlpA family ABC transporter substrate-binding protein n=1 Tax=Kocuria oceani TaxID=988827 RepID=A0ABV9TFV1_9MICC|nr:MetQ/NlpA family ABC transporter substrate-binding protein [Kocuria oceani]
MRSQRLTFLALATTLGLTLTACGGSDQAGGPYDDGVITIGTDGRTQVHEAFLEEAEKAGVEVELVEFTDYNQPNAALTSGDLDMNWFQHGAFLADYRNNSGEDIVPIGSTSIYPLGLYSERYDSLDQIQEGDEIAVPNDAINLARALLLLQSAGLVEFTSDTTAPSELDIDTEASKVRVTPVSAEQTVLSLSSTAGAVVNNTFLSRADIDPNTALYSDGEDNENALPYVNFFAATGANKDDETLHQVADLFHTDAVLAAEQAETKDTAVSKDVPQEELIEVVDRYAEDLQK